MTKELAETIEENAQGPAEVSGDSGAMKQYSLKDQTEAYRYSGAGGQPRGEANAFRRIWRKLTGGGSWR